MLWRTWLVAAKLGKRETLPACKGEVLGLPPYHKGGPGTPATSPCTSPRNHMAMRAVVHLPADVRWFLCRRHDHQASSTSNIDSRPHRDFLQGACESFVKESFERMLHVLATTPWTER